MFFRSRSRSRSRASRRLDPVQAHQRAAHGQAVLLDVRETAEWEAGHAPDALHLPLSRLVAGEALPPTPHGSAGVAIMRSRARWRAGVVML
ncbi:rhodanese-like domain-containing protein, partial [Streptomyces mirabilis]|uniref:rhodanese-like domain-containing protein n=1 Tax=Streptomyces mirabilis TaxID=68239 RepID=UPI0036868616